MICQFLAQPKIKHSIDILDEEDGAVGGALTTSKKPPLSSSSSLGANAESTGLPHEGLNKKALAVINRVRDKLTGRDFDAQLTLDVAEQVDLLIKQATSHENLCQCYIGWCPFW